MFDIKKEKYGFRIKLQKNKELSGLIWESFSVFGNDNGKIDFSMIEEFGDLFVETMFSPENVCVYPIFASSKNNNVQNIEMDSGEWTLKFINFNKSLSSIMFFISEPGSYDSIKISDHIFLEDIEMINLDFKSNRLFDKILIKKSNYCNDTINIGDIQLVNNKNALTLITDDSLIKPEFANIIRSDNHIIFEENSPIWSYCSVKFYNI